MSSKVTCSSCGWSWNKSDSSKNDLYVCHQCGKDNTMKDGGWLNKYNDIPEAQNGIEGTMGGLTDKGFNYNGAWGGTMAMGGSLPGSVGFMYARTQSPAPSNGPYAKKTKASAQNGMEMKYWQEGLDFKPKTISQDGSKTKKARQPKRVIVFAERPLEEGSDSKAFVTEAQNVKNFYKRTSPNTKVEILPVYETGDNKTKQKIQDTLYGLTPDDDVMVFGHHGEKYAGIPTPQWASLLEESNYGNCYLGSCTSEDVATGPWRNVRNLNYRPGSLWLGFNPNASNITDAMFSRGATPPPLTEDEQLGSYIPMPQRGPEAGSEADYQQAMAEYERRVAAYNAVSKKRASIIQKPIKGQDYQTRKGLPQGMVTSPFSFSNPFEYSQRATGLPFSLRPPAKSKKEDGGWLSKFQDGTPDSGVPKVPYWKNKIYRGPSQFDECEGEGCSKQATGDVASLYGADYESLNPQDAWYKRAAVIKSGGQEIYNTSQGDLKSIYGNLRVGDFVSLDRPGSPHAEDPSKIEGYTLADNEGTEHVGYVIGFDANGIPLIKHGHEGNILSSASSYVQPITDLSLPDLGLNYKVSSIYRAKPLLDNNKELNTNYYKDLLPQKDLSFYNEDKSTSDKQQFIDAYNKNSEKFQRETGLSPEEIAAIGNVAYGIFGNESRFNESLYRPVKQLGAEALYALGLRDTPPSLGPTQLKYEQVAENKDKSKTRKGKLMRALGVKKNEIDNVFHPTDYDSVVSATFASLAENYKKLTTDPEFKYDPEKNTVLGNVPLGMALAKSWQNPSLKNVKESLQKGDSDYANAAYRNMSELEGQMFPGKLPEVVITPEKKNGGWLSKYDDGGIIEDPMGQWAHPGEITRIPSNQITMQGVDYPVLGISDTGDTKMMQPGEDYRFKGKSVTEIPMMQEGGPVEKTYGTYRLPEVVITGQAPEKGFWDQSISSFLNENKDAGLLGALSSVVTYPLGLPQQAMMYGLTGKVQRPSEAMGIENPLGALATDVIADPTNLLGIGLADDALRLTSRASKFLTEETALKNAYKINPWAFKPNESNWYRQVGEEAIDDALNTGLIRESREEVSPRMWREFQDQIKRLQGDDALSYEEKYKQQILSSRRPTSPFFAKGELFYPMGRKPTITKSGKISKNAAGKGNADYLIETGLPNESFQPAYGKGMSAGVPTEIGQTAILKPNPSLRDIENFKLYKQDWLRGYKELPTLKQNTGDVGNLDIAKQMKQMNRFFSEDQRFDKLKETTNPESLSMLSDFKKRISTPEGKRRMKELGITRKDMLDALTIVEDPTSYGYYRPSKNKIAIHPDIPLPRIVGRHEVEHGVQRAFLQSLIDKSNKWYNFFSGPIRKQTTEIDDILSDLELRDKPDLNKVWEKDDVDDFPKPIDVSDYKDKVLDRQLATDYFTTGSKGKEKSAFLAEVQQWMMDKGMLPKDSYVEVTPEMVKEAYADAMFDKDGRYLRIFNIMRPTEKNYKKISKGLNKMLAVSPMILGTGAIGSQINQPTQQKNGGWLNKYK